MWKFEITWFSYLFHITFMLFSHFGARHPGQGSEAAARGSGRARPVAALGPQSVKIVWKSCERNMKIMRLHTFALFSHLLHIMFIWFLHLWARDPDPGSQSHVVSYSRSYFFTFFSYSVKTSCSSSSIRIAFTTLVFAIHFPGMKNKWGGPIFHSMENTQFCFFQVEGWPQELDV